MTKAQLKCEIRRLREENSELKKKIKALDQLNWKAFKRQHEAEQKLNALYGSMQ